MSVSKKAPPGFVRCRAAVIVSEEGDWEIQGAGGRRSPADDVTMIRWVDDALTGSRAGLGETHHVRTSIAFIEFLRPIPMPSMSEHAEPVIIEERLRGEL